jgi:hypothetical protein
MTISRYYPNRRTGATSGGGMSDDTLPTNVSQNLFPNVAESDRTAGITQYAKYFVKCVSGVADLAREFISKLSTADDRVVLKKGTDIDTKATAQTYGWIEYSITWSARTVTIGNAVSLAKGDEVSFFSPDGTYKGRALVTTATSSSTTFVIDAMTDGSDPAIGDMAATFWYGAGDLAEAITAANTPYTVVADFEDADGMFSGALVALINHDNPVNGRPPVEYLTVNRCAFTIGEGDVHDDDCSSLTGWTNNDSSGTSSQETYEDRDVFKLTVATHGGSNFAQIYQDVGTIDTSFTVQVRVKHDDVGAVVGDADHFRFDVDNGTTILQIAFGTDGLRINDGSAWNEVGTDIVENDHWTVWRFVVDGSTPGSETVDVYKDDFLIASGVDCSNGVGATDGLVTITQYGVTTDGVTSYVDFLKISDGAPNLAGECFIATETAIQSDYAVKTRAEVQGSASETFNVDGLTLVVQVDGGASQTVTLSGSSQTAAQVVAQISLTGATAYEYTSGKVAIRSDSYYAAGSIQILSSSTADTVLGLSNSIAYGTDGTVASAVLELGDIEPSVTTPVASGAGTYDHSSYPILVYKKGTLTGDVTVTFSDATNFTVSMVVDGATTNLGAGNINSDFQIPHLGEYYFTIQADGWGGTWAATDTLTFPLVQSAKGVWAKEVVPAATDADSGNKTEISFRAQS